MGNAVQLFSNGLIEFRVTMAMHIAPQTAFRIEIAFPVDVGKVASLRFTDNERLVGLHLGKRMPDRRAIPRFQLFDLLFVHYTCQLIVIPVPD